MPHLELGGGGTQPPSAFKIINFTNDKLVNEKGTIIDTIMFSWNYLTNDEISQYINPNVGIIANGLRTITLTGQSITENTKFVLSATDGIVTKTASTQVYFYYPIYVGLVDSEIAIPSEIENMEKCVAPQGSFIHDFVIDDQRSAIAIHHNLPPLKDIRETVFNMSMLHNFNIYDNVYVPTEGSIQPYKVYIWKTRQNTSGQNQPLNFVW